MSKFRPTFGEALRNVGGYLCYGQTSHPGGVAKLAVTSCHRNPDKVRLNGHLSECRFYLFHYLQCISGKPDNLWCNEGTIIRVIVIFRVMICLNNIFVGVTDWLFRSLNGGHQNWVNIAFLSYLKVTFAHIVITVDWKVTLDLPLIVSSAEVVKTSDNFFVTCSKMWNETGLYAG